MTCSTCIYWQSNNKTCHKNPPEARHGFPIVSGGDWCGEFASEIAPVMAPQPVKADAEITWPATKVSAPVVAAVEPVRVDPGRPKKTWRERLGI